MDAITYQEAFEKVKTEVSKSVLDHHFDVLKETRVNCNDSLTGLGASIEQNHNGVWKTIAFASQFLNGAEIKYSTNELGYEELFSPQIFTCVKTFLIEQSCVLQSAKQLMPH